MWTYSFVFYLNSVFPATLDITQLFAQFNSRWILHSNDHQKIFRYFSRTAIFAFFNTPLFALLITTVAGFPILFDLYLNDDEFFVLLLRLPVLVAGVLSLLNYHKLSDVSE